jgi:hypothetical protein
VPKPICLPCWRKKHGFEKEPPVAKDRKQRTCETCGRPTTEDLDD